MNYLDIWEYFNNPFQDDWDHVGTAKIIGAFHYVPPRAGSPA